MTRTSTQKKSRRDAFYEYRLSADGYCEISRYLVSDRDAVAWMKNIKLDGTEVHHIAGRGKDERHEWFCNLILLTKAAHAWVHHNPVEGEILCWYAKRKHHLALEIRLEAIGLKLLPVADRLHWNPNAVSLIVTPFDGLCGRIHYLAGKTDDPLYLGYARELLEVLGE